MKQPVLNTKYHIIFFLFMGLFLSACEKSDDASDVGTGISQIKILDESNVANALTVVSGNGSYLLLYTNTESQYFAKLMTNEGVELWTKNISEETGLLTSDPALTIEEVLYDIDGTFAFFSGQRLFKLDIQGEVVYDNPDFTSGIPDGNNQSRILNVFITSDGGYFVSGSFRANQAIRYRAFYTKYSRTGIVEFSKLFFINTDGQMGITSGVEHKNGYTLGGFYSSENFENKTSFYILNLSNEGEILWSQIHETASVIEQSFAFKILGRELIQLTNGNMMYIMVPGEELAEDQRSKGYIVDELGVLVDSVLFDLEASNIAGATSPAIGKGIVQLKDKGFAGINNPTTTEVDINAFTPINYELPRFGYSYAMDAIGNIGEMKIINQTASNNLSSISLLSNGKTIIFGIQASMNNELRLFTILNE